MIDYIGYVLGFILLVGSIAGMVWYIKNDKGGD